MISKTVGREKRIILETVYHVKSLNYEVLNCKRPVHTELAILIEAALGIEADMLIRMQSSYNMQIARKNKKLIERLNEIRKITAVL